MTKTPVPAAVTTPSKVESGIGALEFTDGYPTRETAEKLRDHLDYLHGVEAFMNSIQGVSVYALRKGFLEAGINDGDVLIFSELMDSRSLFLTANADTVYYIAFLDLSDGPLVVETPEDALGVIDDMWFHWVTDFGLPGADRGQGGAYLLVGPGYDGPLPEGGYYVRHSRTNHAVVLGRSFINENPGNDPVPTADLIKAQMKIYPYAPGGAGSSIGGYLTGTGPLGQPASPQSPRFVEGTGLAFNTVPPNDFGHYELLDALVQMEPAEALDTELAGQFGALGIVKDERFAPDDRLRRILDDAVAVGNAASRTLGMAGPSDRRLPLLRRRLSVVDPAVGRWVRVHQPAARDHRGRDQALPEQGGPPAALPHRVPLHGNWDHARHVHAADRRGVAVPDRQRRRRRRTLRRLEDLSAEAAEGHPGGPVLVAHPLRQPDPLDAADRAALSPGRQPELPLTGSGGGVGRVDRCPLLPDEAR
jgi:hypothetical protein